MDEKEKIYFMLEEYRAVRAELLQVTALRAAVYLIAGAAFIGVWALAGWLDAYKTAFSITFLLGVVLVIATEYLAFNIRSARSRLLEIESQVNRRSNDELFGWQTKRALGRVEWQRTRMEQAQNLGRTIVRPNAPPSRDRGSSSGQAPQTF